MTKRCGTSCPQTRRCCCPPTLILTLTLTLTLTLALTLTLTLTLTLDLTLTLALTSGKMDAQVKVWSESLWVQGQGGAARRDRRAEAGLAVGPKMVREATATLKEPGYVRTVLTPFLH